TLMRGKMRRPSGDCAMPSRTMRFVGSPSSRWPLKLTVPRRGRTVPRIVRSAVVLPAPLAPISVTISRGATDSEMPRSARMLAYDVWTSTRSSTDLPQVRYGGELLLVAGAQIRLDHARVALDLGRRALGDPHPVVEHGDAIRDPHHDAHVVLD